VVQILKTRHSIARKIHIGFSLRSNDSLVLESSRSRSAPASAISGKRREKHMIILVTIFLLRPQNAAARPHEYHEDDRVRYFLPIDDGRARSRLNEPMEHRRVNRISRDYANLPKFRDGGAIGPPHSDCEDVPNSFTVMRS